MNRTEASFWRQWTAEKKKLKRRRVWLIPLCFLLFDVVWVLWQLKNATPDDLADGYLMLFYNFPLMNTIMLPLMTVVIASRLCDMEIKGDTRKLLYTIQRPSAFYGCKYLTGLSYIVFFALAQVILIVAAGRIYRFQGTCDPVALVCHAAVIICVSAALLSIWQLLSLCSENQILPLAAGLCGSFLGLFSMFFPASVARLILFGYYAAFPVSGLYWEAETRYSEYYEIVFPLHSFLLFFLFTIVLYFVCRAIAAGKEV